MTFENEKFKNYFDTLAARDKSGRESNALLFTLIVLRLRAG